MLRRYFIELSYLGTHYHGWQIQENAVTVQQVLHEALSKLFHSPELSTGCGRTDTGVHARQFYAHVNLDLDERNLSPKQLMHKLNMILPFDIAIHQILPVHSEAHARFDATKRTYEYHISTKKNPFNRHLSLSLPFPDVDFDLMNEAANILFEYNDFQCFSKTGTQVNNYLCKIMKAQWEKWEGDNWVFVIQADRFLRNMVRAIVGTLLEVGRGQMSLEEYRRVIESKNRSGAGWSVPPEGLFLTKIEYPFIG